MILQLEAFYLFKSSFHFYFFIIFDLRPLSCRIYYIQLRYTRRGFSKLIKDYQQSRLSSSSRESQLANQVQKDQAKKNCKIARSEQEASKKRARSEQEWSKKRARMSQGERARDELAKLGGKACKAGGKVSRLLFFSNL